MTITGALAVILRPLVAVLLLLTAYFLARGVMRFVPHGRVRDMLNKRFTVIPEGPVSPAVMWFCRGLIVLVVLLIVFKPFRYL